MLNGLWHTRTSVPLYIGFFFSNAVLADNLQHSLDTPPERQKD